MNQFIFIVNIFFLLLVSCSYMPTKVQPDKNVEQNCQTRCMRSGMMVDPSSQTCGCISYPGK